MKKEQNVVRYYVLCNKLKNIIRSGWKVWNVERERIESVAEHIFGTQMLAIGMYSEYEYDLDIMKVIYMLAVHELEEIIIGDIPVSSLEYKDQQKDGHKAVQEVLGNLLSAEYIKSIVFEFDARRTKEALFAYHCDKLECSLQAKIYSEENCFDISKQQNNPRFKTDPVQNLLENGAKTLADFWLPSDKHYYEDDKNFMKVFEYIRDNDIL